MALTFGTSSPLHDDSDYGRVARAADCLKLSEFNVFRLAYRRWHGREGESRSIERTFGRYLSSGIAPHWVRHLTRDLIGDGRDRERFDALDLPRRDAFPTAPPTPVPVYVFFGALVAYLLILT